MTTGTQPSNPPAPPVPSVADRLAAIEKRLDELKPGKDRWDKFEKLSVALWAIVTYLVSVLVTGRIETALKERELHLENVKDMQEIMVQFHSATDQTAMSSALALGAHGRYAAVPLIQELQAGIVGHRPAAEAGLRAAAAIDHDVVCRQLSGVIDNRTRLYQFEVHESAARLLADLECVGAIDALTQYKERLAGATPATAPFTGVNFMASRNDPAAADLDRVRTQAEAALTALRSVKSEPDTGGGWHRWFGGSP